MAAKASHARILAAALLLATLIAYAPVIFTGGWIWDDPQYIVGNPLLRTWPGLLAIWIHPSLSSQYYPLVYTTFWVEYHLVGLHPCLYHVDNILLHALSAILLWRLLLRLGAPAALLAATIFALHPVQVESVAWATERKNVLSLVLYLLSLQAYLNFRDHPRSGTYALSLLLFLAALLSKSVTCSLPAAIVLIVYWKNGKLRWSDIGPLIPFFILGGAMAFVTAHLEKYHVGASGPEWAFTFPDRCLIAGRALWFYAAKLLWPHPLIFIYPRWIAMSVGSRPWLIVFPLAAIGALLSLWLLRKKTGRAPMTASLFYCGTLLPALGFVNLYPMRYSFVADHFQYQASIGLIALFAAGLRRLGAIVCTALLFALGFLTWRQGWIYQNQLVLWQDVVAHNPDSWMAQGNLGDEYAALSNREDFSAADRKKYRALARACYARLYQLAPQQPLAHLKWGIVKEYDGDLEAAQREFDEALKLAPTFAVAMNSKGIVLMKQHEPQKAMEEFRKAIALDPDYAEARVNYGDALLSMSDRRGAFEQYSQAASRRPDNVEAQFKLANMLLTNFNRPDLALPHYLAAVGIDPNRADIRVNLALTLFDLGHLYAARQECREALRLNPNFSPARLLWAQLTG